MLAVSIYTISTPPTLQCFSSQSDNLFQSYSLSIYVYTSVQIVYEVHLDFFMFMSNWNYTTCHINTLVQIFSF